MGRCHRIHAGAVLLMSLHVIPQNDERQHAYSGDCWCEPRVQYLDPETNLPYPRGPMVVHNSADCREVSERITGEIVSQAHKWVGVEVT